MRVLGRRAEVIDGIMRCPWVLRSHPIRIQVSLKVDVAARAQVMGMMQGKVEGDTFIVVDTFALPVEGTETRVNAHEGAYEYMIAYPETAKARRRTARLVSPAKRYRM